MPCLLCPVYCATYTASSRKSEVSFSGTSVVPRSPGQAGQVAVSREGR